MTFGYGPLGDGDQPSAAAQTLNRYKASFNAPNSAGAQTWTCPRTGEYTIYAWGHGGKGGINSGDYAGSSGALAIWQRVRFQAGDTATITIPERASTTGDTTVSTARKATVLTAGRGGDGSTGVAGAVGVASNGDVNINGSAGLVAPSAGNPGGGTDGGSGSTNTGSPGAPGYDGLRGGDGAITGYPGGTPGAGGQQSSGGDPQRLGGCGFVIICRDK